MVNFFLNKDPRFGSILKTTQTQVRNNNIALQDDDTLEFPLVANGFYAVEIVLVVDSTAVADFRLSFDVPALCDALLNAGGRDGGNVTVVTQFSSLGATPDLIWRGYAAARCGPTIQGVVVNGANAGDFKVQWAQSVAEVSDTRVIIGSYIKWMRIG